MSLPSSPLELARMHEAELKQCSKQIREAAGLVSRIMVGRKVKHPGFADPIEVKQIKIVDGIVCLFAGRSRKPFARGLANVEIVP